MDNFTFLKDEYPQFYKAAIEAEENIWTNSKGSGNKIRILCEDVIHYLTNLYDMEGIIYDFSNKSRKQGLKFYDYLNVYSNKKAIEVAVSRDPERRKGLTPLSFDVYAIFGASGLRAYKVPTWHPEKIEPGKMDYKTISKPVEFLRQYGNDCSHPYDDSTVYVDCFDGTLKQIKLFHNMMQRYFRKDGVIEPYDDNLISLPKLDIHDAYTPFDMDYTGCIMEGEATDLSGNRNPHTILRKYFVEAGHHTWQTRSMEAFLSADGPANGVPEGMAWMNVVLDGKNWRSPYYIISYSFGRKPEKLTTELLSRINEEERQMICQKLACSLQNLHNGSVPIYHRMLNNDSIRLCDFTDSEKGWVPSIINYEFAKIQNPKTDLYVTVAGELFGASKKKLARGEKYLAPEFSSGIAEENWAKLDIYALGILYTDILVGRIDNERKNLEFEQIPEELKSLIQDMTNDDPKERPDINEVLYRLEKFNNRSENIVNEQKGSLIRQWFARIFQ